MHMDGFVVIAVEEEYVSVLFENSGHPEKVADALLHRNAAVVRVATLHSGYKQAHPVQPALKEYPLFRVVHCQVSVERNSLSRQPDGQRSR